MNLKINTKLLPIKVHFFLCFAATAPVVPFVPIYAKQMGIDTLGVGVIFATLPFMGMIAKPIACWIADRFSLQKLVFLSGIMVTGGGYICLMLVPPLVPDLTTLLHCSSPLSLLKVCRPGASPNSLELPQTLNCSLTCSTPSEKICSAFSPSPSDCGEDTELRLNIWSNLSQHDTQPVPTCLYIPVDSVTSYNSSIPNPVCSPLLSVQCQAICHHEQVQTFIRQDSVFYSPSFWIFFLLNILAFSAFGVFTSMGDAICFDLLGDKHEDYGYQRVWGSIGWGLLTVTAGWLVDQGSGETSKDYSPAFLLLTCLLLMDFILTGLTLTISRPGTNTSGLVWAEVVGLVCRPRVMTVVVWCVVCGALQGVYWHWLPIYLDDLANAHNCRDWLTLIIGLNMAVQCFLGEVPMFFLSGWILRTLGHSNTMTLVLGVFSLRSLLYTFLINPWYSLLIEVLNGVTFGIFYATMTSYAHILSPPGLESTMQGVVGAAFEGLGVSVGTLVGGALYKALNGRWLFRIFSALAMLFCLTHAILNFWLDKKDSSETNERNQKRSAEFSLVETVNNDNCQTSNTHEEQGNSLLT